MMRTLRETDSIARDRRISNEAIRTSRSEVKSGNSIPLVLKRIDVSICARDCAVYLKKNKTKFILMLRIKQGNL